MNEKMKNELAKALAAISENIPFVNCGGCGIVAYALSSALARKGIRSSITKIGYLKHIVVKVDGTYFDSTGIFAVGEKEMLDNASEVYSTSITSRLSRNELGRMVACDAIWNKLFNRKKHMLKLINLVKLAVNEAMASDLGE